MIGATPGDESVTTSKDTGDDGTVRRETRETSMPTLILSPRYSDDSIKLRRAAVALGWDVMRLASWRCPEDFEPEEPVLFAEPLFNEAVAEQLDLAVVEPPEDFLVRLPEQYVKRRVRLTTAAEARTLPGPVFLKPPNRKTFPARVYASGAELPEMPDEDPVLASEPVEWAAEFRSFVRDRRVHAWISEWYQAAEPVAQDDRAEGQVPRQGRRRRVARHPAGSPRIDPGQAGGQATQMRRPEGAVVDAADQVAGQPGLAVQRPQPAAQDRTDRVGVAAGTDRLREGEQRIVAEAEEAEGGERQGVNHEARRPADLSRLVWAGSTHRKPHRPVDGLAQLRVGDDGPGLFLAGRKGRSSVAPGATRRHLGDVEGSLDRPEIPVRELGQATSERRPLPGPVVEVRPDDRRPHRRPVAGRLDAAGVEPQADP
jgi:hypothetical protein